MEEKKTASEKRQLTPEEKKERRRKRQYRKLCRLTSACIILLTLLISIFNIIIPRSRISNIERRELAKFPSFSLSSYFSGEFTSGINTWYTDTVPFRDTFKNAGNNIKSLFGIASGETAVIVGNANKVGASDKTQETPTKKPAETVKSSSAAETTQPATTAESLEDQKDYTREEVADADFENGILVVQQDGHWRGMPLFVGGDGEVYANFMNALRDTLDDDVRLYSMPVPLASEFYTPSNYSDYTASHAESFAALKAQLKSGITTVDLIDVFKKHTEEEIFCRTDHHWQPLGAYYAAKAFCETAGVPFPDLSSYTKEANEGYVGTLYAYTSNANLLNDPEDFTYYVPTVEYNTDYYDTSFNYEYTSPLLVETDTENSYLMFMGSDMLICKITTAVDNDRKLMIMKDSYGNAMIPFFTGSFSEVYVTDMRYFDLNLPEFIESMGITDVLFSSCSSSTFGQNAYYLENYLTQYAGTPIVDGAPAAAVGKKNSSSSGSSTGSNASSGTTGTAGTADDTAASSSAEN